MQKKAKKVRYWISYRMPDGKQRRESVGAFEGLDAYSITDARNAESKRVVQKVEKLIFDMLPGSDMTFSELFDWYKELKTVKRLSSYNRVIIALNNFNEVFGNRIASTLKPEDLENYQEERQGQGTADATIDMELSIAQTMVDKAFVNDMIDGRALKPFKVILDSQPHALHHDYVFSYRGNSLRGPQGIRKAFKTTCEAIDIDYGKSTDNGLIFADFRRTVKTYMVEAGVDKVYRDTILGHSLKGMDMHYIKPSDQTLKAALDKYTEWLDGQIAAKNENVDHSVDQVKVN